MADKLLKSIKFPTLPDRYVIGDSTLTEEGAAADAKAVGDALATKADTSGTYEDLIVGGAEQLMADEYETDKDPYLFRPTGGSADVGNREYVDKIVGGTVAWNQLVPNALSDGSGTASANYTTIATLTESNDIIPVGHKILVTGKIKSNNGTGVFLAYSPPNVTQGGNAGTTNTSLTSVGFIYSVDANYTGRRVRIVGMSGDTATWEDVQLHDLTALFNPTIADYIYSLEQSQAGAGVAWFRQYFPKDYYPYDPGTLRSVEGVSAHETVGFNQWDEEWEVGDIDGRTGQPEVGETVWRSKNFIRIVPSASYYAYSPTNGGQHSIRARFYDANQQYIGTVDKNGHNIRTEVPFVVPDNARYMKFSPFNSEMPTHELCINLSDPTRNGEYEPYEKHTYPLDSSLTLRGTPKLVDGKLAFDGDVYPPSGEVQRRYKQVTLTGSENWRLENGASDAVGNPTSRFYIEKNDLKKPSGNANTRDYTNHMTSTIPTLKGGYVNQFDITGIEMGVTGYQGGGDNNYLYIIVNNTINTTITTVDALKSWLSSHPLEVVYELATPTTETADGYEQCQRCDPSGTEAFATTGIVPVGHETRYPHDLKKKVETAPDSPSADGTYLMKRSGGKNAYMALPSTPSANGAYVLTVTVSGGNASYSWTKKE